jgi:PAS domain S-box-containing protein
MVLVVSLLTTLVDRLQNQRAHLDELFEQAPQAVVLMSIDNRIVRVNREFTRLFGYTSQESIGRYLNELIVPDEFQDEYQRYADLAARGQRVERDGVRRRKNGSYINVSIILVPISVPGGRVERYAIFRDITERQRAESERDKLFNAVRSSNEQLQVLSRRLVEVQEEERKRLAREIHDDISQSLTALMMLLGSARNLLPKTARAARSILEQTEALTQSTLERTRLMIAGLRPSILDELGLGPALHRLADELHESTGALVTLKTNGLPKRLPSQIEIALFRIAQEALANIRKHAQASEVTVELTNGDGHIILLVQDNGVGIENQEAGSSQSANVVLAAGWKIPAGHFGLIGIQERVKSLGGNFQLTSAPNQGTTIRVELPL